MFWEHYLRICAKMELILWNYGAIFVEQVTLQNKLPIPFRLVHRFVGLG
jgi:hypothetical protein